MGVGEDEFGNWEKFTKENEMNNERVTEISWYMGVLECGCFSLLLTTWLTQIVFNLMKSQ